ncbi:MAG: DinB family protein [Candidatus Heimdallarchaeota archaeon]
MIKMNLKLFAIETMEIAEWNVIRTLLRLKPEHLDYQITTNLNPIKWIIGHLANQVDFKFNYLCQGKRKATKEFSDYFKTGAKGVTEEKEFPLSKKEVIEIFLEYTSDMFDFLEKLPEDKFTELPEFNIEGNTETITEIIQRVALHFLGHTGQIQWIKKELGKGGYFVTGVKKKQRDDSRIKWFTWWNKNKDSFK